MATAPHDDAMSTKEHWRNTVLAGLANYIDAGSIVAGSVALALWKDIYHLSDGFIGLIGAFSANAISAGVGALIGGWLCDKIGRKKIYQWDMFIYAFGMAMLVFAWAPWMIVTGFVIVGLAVGADIPASWSLIAEQAPDKERGKHSGVAQALWYLGPVVVLLLSLALTNLGILGTRIVFAHLLVIALALTLLRSKMRESERWEEAQRSDVKRPPLTDLFKPKHLASLAMLVGMYGFWNLWSGTNGFFFPYILRTVGAATQAQSVAIQALSFFIGMLSIWFVFMRLADKVNQRLLFAASALIQIIGMALLALFPLTLPIAILHVFLLQFGGGFGAQSFFQLWSAEMFPTLLRSTAQGMAFAVVRIGLGIFSFFVPYLTATGFHTLAWILTGFLVISGVIGIVWAPRNEGKSLEQLDAERQAN
ncbi:MAG TPA: MFS transporter [Sphingobium sp.]|uniref:MFS transporter n=1 Tax=Sphingobium sp. TaxID=1912891 RepID=UPI002ED61569